MGWRMGTRGVYKGETIHYTVSTIQQYFTIEWQAKFEEMNDESGDEKL